MAILSTLSVFLVALFGGCGVSDWDATWAKLARLQGLQKGAEGAQGLFDELARDREAAPEGTRRALLGAHLSNWSGAPKQLIPAQVSSRGLSGHESWLLAAVLPTSPQRARSVLSGLSQTEKLNSYELDIAWRTAVAEVEALRLSDSARPIQEILHQRYAAGWTASNLGLTLRTLGDLDALDRMMQQIIAQEEATGRSSAELWSQWGLALLGAGNEQRARDYLGCALLRGSSNAALILGRLDLQQGHLEAARSSFRPSLLTEKPSAWALRGWGASLLAKAQTKPTGSQPSAPRD